ncbi:MAG: hypothetical protein HQ591_03820 [candidate division Zixibacteria bacterium]|nr:hypothetical protein [Candidatus Tariuqbacter arcticus]
MVYTILYIIARNVIPAEHILEFDGKLEPILPFFIRPPIILNLLTQHLKLDTYTPSNLILST